MKRNAIETVMGAVVLIVAGLFIYFAYGMTRFGGGPDGYPLQASFFKLGDLAVGSDVRISGIRVGKVTARHLDRETYEAVVTISVDKDIKLADDTVASIASEGLMGGKYLRLEPGHSGTVLEPGGQIKETRSYRSLEDQVGEIIFLATGSGGGDQPSGPTP
jgi:phospholipid/cholesterol/gamma-HCH transport system substrate-binding protein